MFGVRRRCDHHFRRATTLTLTTAMTRITRKNFSKSITEEYIHKRNGLEVHPQDHFNSILEGNSPLHM